MTDEFTKWRKSSRSGGGQCVEVGSWRKASFSTYNGSCVEVGHGPAEVGVRDSSDPDGAVLTFDAGAWQRFADGLKHMPILSGPHPSPRSGGPYL